MNKFLLAILFSVFLIFTACSKDDSPTENNPQTSVLKGTWIDSVNVSDANSIRSFKLSLTLNEANGNISGNFSGVHKTTFNSATMTEASSGTIDSGVRNGNNFTIVCNSSISLTGEIDDSNPNEINIFTTVKLSRIDSTYTFVYEMNPEKIN